MEVNFEGKCALVTGAGKGIGRAIAKALVKCGAKTTAVSRTQADLDSLKNEVPRIQTVQLDLSNWEETQEVMKTVGHVDLLVNNAGTVKVASFFDITKEDIDTTYDVNVKAIVSVSQILARTMVDRGQGGSIVNVSSAGSQHTVTDLTVYCSSKAAVDMITKSMAAELGPKKVRVNAVNPTVVMTELAKKYYDGPKKTEPLLARIPMGKFVELEDVVNSVLFLLSDKAAMINGITLPVEGGLLTGHLVT